ncbi:Hypothetical protein CM240_1565 [Clostridium bornimense]|uniref:Uncharacterized protein n=1 Tax=Clostridium bornimense TaxID=1216932 RepID=W6RWH9_9CLOT|nr:cold shock domain-containing protein [Clostridium bornimense]CDM68723.1 Hypothetical protein CM240_1565 [Clostridium bornimense]
MSKNTGVIKWFNNEIGCGFVETKYGINIFVNDLYFNDNNMDYIKVKK